MQVCLLKSNWCRYRLRKHILCACGLERSGASRQLRGQQMCVMNYTVVSPYSAPRVLLSDGKCAQCIRSLSC